MAYRLSRWRDDAVWKARLEDDGRRIGEQLTADQQELLERLPISIEQSFHVHFALVFGSRARGDHQPDSDVDIYIEAMGLPEDPNLAPVVPDSNSNVVLVPAGVLALNVPDGEEFATQVVNEALISYDTGAFREILITLDEEGLLE